MIEYWNFAFSIEKAIHCLSRNNTKRSIRKLLKMENYYLNNLKCAPYTSNADNTLSDQSTTVTCEPKILISSTIRDKCSVICDIYDNHAN
jgi:hypothetical protein